VPHELPPAEHLPDESLDALDGRRVALPSVDGGVDHLPRAEQPQVQRRRQQGVSERGLAADHGVLIGAERGEAVFDEVIERVESLGPCDRPREPRRLTPSVEPLGDPVQRLAGQLVRFEPRDRWRRPVVGRRLAVRFVVVPLPADGVVAVHQHALAAPHPSVEVLVTESVAVVPRVERLGRAAKPVVVDERERSAAGFDEAPQALGGAVARRAHESQVVARTRLEVSVEGVAERPCPPVGHVVACLSEGVAGVTHGREDETELLGVVRLSVGEGRRFDQ